MDLNPDTSQQKQVRTRQRTSASCTECRRRKQKCNQARDRPCNNCSRRYPPVPCEYETLIRKVKSKIKVGEGKINTEPSAASLSASERVSANVTLPRQHDQQFPIRSMYGELPSVFHKVAAEAALREPRASSKDISPAIRQRMFYDYPEHFHKDDHEDTKLMLGGVALQALEHLPLECTKRNVELLHFFIQRLSPYMSSIDGQDPPSSFTRQWFPFMIQSPITAQIAILTAAYFQASTRSIDISSAVDAISAKVKVISLINEHIASHSKGVNDESIAAVMSLAYNELVYADDRSTLAHMNGLREMVKTRGSVEDIRFPILRKLLLAYDYQIASTYECELFLHSHHASEPIPILSSYSDHLDSPLLQSSTRFESKVGELHISPDAARLLDDMRFLTTSVISFSSPTTQDTTELEAKSKATVKWIHERLLALSSPPSSININPSISSLSPDNQRLQEDFIYQTLLTTSTIYTHSLLHRIPLSQACTSTLLTQLWSTMWRVPLPTWKKLPGIFFWVLLVANPFARDRPEGRFLKGLMPSCLVAIGMEEESQGWKVAMAQVRGFMRVQRWLGGLVWEEGVRWGSDVSFEKGSEINKEEKERSMGKESNSSTEPENAFPDWSFKE